MNPGSMLEGVRLAIEQLRTNRFRSFLTILGIVIGVGVVMVMSAMIGGIRGSVLGELEALGPKNFIVVRYNFNQARPEDEIGPPPWARRPKITLQEARALERLPTVKLAIPDYDFGAEFTAGTARVDNVNMSADGAGWEQFTTGTFVTGRNFIEGDVRAARPLVVISKPLSDALFGSLNPVGRQVRIRGAAFTVVGVFELNANIFASVIKNIAIVPYTAALKYLNRGEDYWTAIAVVTADDATQAEAMDEVVTALRTMRGLRPGDENTFDIVRQEEILNQFNRITGIFFLVMISLSSVALMVGGVGVIAIMMIAVTERTREIGIRKALGATRREILWQFLVESVTVTLIGSIIGMLLGSAGAFAIAATTPIPASVPFAAIVAALLMAATAGIVFGLWPAWRASRLDPVEALRYE